MLMVPPSLGVGVGVEAVLACALAIEGRASALAAAMPKDARNSERLVGWVIDVSFLFERLAGVEVRPPRAWGSQQPANSRV
jgi:hypothetical protein